MTEIMDESLHYFRLAREQGTLRPLLERLGADPEALEREAADLAATDATPAEAFIMGIMAAAVVNNQIAFIVEIPPTGPTGPTERRKTRPGLRRRG